MQVQVDLVPPEDRKAKPSDVLNVAFGTVFTDHMLSVEFASSRWTNARIHEFRALQLDPAALCLHYGQAIFEGMKAYQRDSRVFIFRPIENIRRMNRSAERMVMPQLDEQFALDSLTQLLDIEREWVRLLQNRSWV
jgi:branched-chain amino acid aminotransferase